MVLKMFLTGDERSVGWLKTFSMVAVWLGCVVLFTAVGQSYPEVVIADADFKNMDTVATATLAKADRVFNKKDYRAAAAEYELFAEENQRSSAVAYALLRKGRSEMLDNKCGAAIRSFQEVVDYFDKSSHYAAAALYYQGQCHFSNGDRSTAIKVWRKLVANEDYAKHYLAAPAFLALANELSKDKKYAEAAAAYEQAAVEFRSKNSTVARQAIDLALDIHMRIAPNAKQLRAMYDRVKTTRANPEAPNDDKYWSDLPRLVKRYADKIPAADKAARSLYFKYWADAMEGQRLSDNSFHIDLAWFRLQEDGSVDGWLSRLERQFNSTFKPGNNGQVVQFLQAVGKQKAAVQKYYAKLDMSTMNNAALEQLARTLAQTNGEVDMARNACARINQDEWNDTDRNNLIGWVQHIDREMVEMLCQRMKDPDFGKFRLLTYYHWRNIADKGIPLAEEVAAIPKYAGQAYWMKAELHERRNELDDAIKAYRVTNREPDSLFRIADCMRRQKKSTEAIAQLKEIEGFFAPQAPEAALRIAWIYRDNKEEKQFIAALRGILKKYPRSGQSNTAHLELERRGVKMGGGVDAD